MMKKSNALMLSYMIFLVISLFANVIGNWNGLDKIAIAATIAGYFFALADLFNRVITISDYFYSKMKIANEKLANIVETQSNFLKERDEELKSLLDIASPYQGKNSDMDGMIDCIKTILADSKSKTEKYSKFSYYCEKSNININKKRSKSKIFEFLELVLMILGFVSFFSTISFDYLIVLLNNCQSFVTVIAFIVIIFNYYAKDFIEERFKTKADEMIKIQDDANLELEETIQDFKEIGLRDTINNIIKTLEDENNGKIENALNQ